MKQLTQASLIAILALTLLCSTALAQGSLGSRNADRVLAELERTDDIIDRARTSVSPVRRA